MPDVGEEMRTPFFPEAGCGFFAGEDRSGVGGRAMKEMSFMAHRLSMIASSDGTWTSSLKRSVFILLAMDEGEEVFQATLAQRGKIEVSGEGDPCLDV